MTFILAPLIALWCIANIGPSHAQWAASYDRQRRAEAAAEHRRHCMMAGVGPYGIQPGQVMRVAPGCEDVRR